MDEQASKLIGDIYDAALDPALWTSVLQQIAHFVGGTAAALYAKDTVRKTGNFFRMFGVETEFVRSYFAPFQIRSATGQHRRHGGVSGGKKGRGQGL